MSFATPEDLSALGLEEILPKLEEASRRLAPYESIEYLIPDPDLCLGRYAGEELIPEGRRYLCRSWRSWNDLAALTGFRILTPRPFDDRRVVLRLSRLGDESFHRAKESEEKYTAEGTFARIHKEEEPAFFYYYTKALQRLGIPKRRRILDLGLYRGDELLPLRALDPEGFAQKEIIGVDLAAEALEEARARFAPALRTYRHDLNALDSLPLGRFDLILSIGTLQSPGIEMKPLIMRLVQEHLAPGGALLLGWPNSRWIDGELLYGARAPHYPFSELSLVIKDLFWIKKYLQQHRFRVAITGREYLFLEATPIGR